MIANSVTYRFPVPPSANGIWKRTRRGNRLSDAYQGWLLDAWQAVATHGKVTPRGPVQIVAILHAGYDWPWKRDLDNIIKPLIDGLRKTDVLPTDSTRHVRRIETALVFIPQEKSFVEVTVSTMKGCKMEARQ